MRYKRISALATVGILLVSVGLGSWALSQTSILAALAKQNGISLQVEGTTLEMTMYGDPDQIRPVFDIFQYFKTENLQWKGDLPQPMGAPPSQAGHIGMNLSFIEFQKTEDPNRYNLSADDYEFHIWATDVVDGYIKADSVNANITFWMSEDLPALNITVLLTGNVIVRLSGSVVPLGGISFVAYECVGPRYSINICVIKPVQVTITEPSEEDTVGGVVPIRASIKVAPGIKVRNVWWYADGPSHYEGGMHYDEGTAEASWETWHGPDGDYSIKARVEAYQESAQGPTWWIESPPVKVSVDNGDIHVTSWVWNGDQQKYIQEDGVRVNSKLNGMEKQDVTAFDIDRYRWYLEAPDKWDFGGGQVPFRRWVISDGDPTFGWIWEHGGMGIRLEDWMLEKLYEEDGELQILYGG